MSHFIVTGAIVAEGEAAPTRLEINDLIKDKVQFSLYVQAIERMYADKQDELLSHFQIGGIHGLPYVSWNGVGPDKDGNTEGTQQWGGYCTHGTVTFPTWHRAYMMLYEQILQKRAIEIANTYTESNGVRDRFVKAAKDLRAPFWDWASSAVPPNEVIQFEQLSIIGPDGQTRNVNNPLLGYKFHPIDPSFTGSFSQWPATLRHPTPRSAPDAKSNVTELISFMENEQEQITQQTYHLLLRINTWPDFSNHTAGEGDPVSSLESIHDGIHVNVGWGGHMGNAGVAGFDPIFFLHHANVDRLLSLWQAVHPDAWVTQGSSVRGSWTIPPGVPVNTDTDLTPFRANNPKGFWASSETTTTARLGYTYPEFNGPSSRSDIIAKIDQLYGDVVLGASSRTAESGSRAVGFVPPAEAPAGRISDWVARVNVKKYELGTSFSVLFFLGKTVDIPEDVAGWRSSPYYVGGHHVFVNSAAEHCANCREQGELVVEGFVHLDRAIARNASSLGSFEPDVIVPYLKENLQWRIQKNDGNAVAFDQCQSLEITVATTPLNLEPTAPSRGTGRGIPTTSGTRYYPDITAGRPGGATAA